MKYDLEMIHNIFLSPESLDNFLMNNFKGEIIKLESDKDWMELDESSENIRYLREEIPVIEYGSFCDDLKYYPKAYEDNFNSFMEQDSMIRLNANGSIWYYFISNDPIIDQIKKEGI